MWLFRNNQAVEALVLFLLKDLQIQQSKEVKYRGVFLSQTPSLTGKFCWSHYTISNSSAAQSSSGVDLWMTDHPCLHRCYRAGFGKQCSLPCTKNKCSSVSCFCASVIMHKGVESSGDFTLVMQLGRDNQRQGVSGCGEQGPAALHSCSSQGQRRKLWEKGSGDTTVNTCCAFAVYPEKRLEFIVSSSETHFEDYFSYSERICLLFCMMSLEPTKFPSNCTAGNHSVFW